MAEGEGVQRWGEAWAFRCGHPPGVSPNEQCRLAGTAWGADGGKPGGVQQAHGRDAGRKRWVPWSRTALPINGSQAWRSSSTNDARASACKLSRARGRPRLRTPQIAPTRPACR